MASLVKTENMRQPAGDSQVFLPRPVGRQKVLS